MSNDDVFDFFRVNVDVVRNDYVDFVVVYKE